MSATGLTRAAVQELGVGAVVLDGQGQAWQRVEDGDCIWRSIEWREDLTSAELHRDCRPLALLFDPARGYVPRDGAQLALPLRRTAGAK